MKSANLCLHSAGGNAEMIWQYLLFMAMGFLSGSVLYSYLLPKWLRGIDILALSDDQNPGTANAMKFAGAPVGFLCLFMDLLKGFLPVWLALHTLSPFHPLFSLVLAAPALGHAFSPILQGKGGKAIAVSFGTLLAFLPDFILLLLLAGFYIFFSVILVIHPNERRTVATFLLFAAAQIFLPHPIPVKIGMLLIADVVIYKNWRDALGKAPSEEPEAPEPVPPDKMAF